MFDEPSSYLDVKQRLRAALTIRSLVATGQGGSAQTYVLVVEHDLAVLDYLSDYICCLYGTPSAYGVVTMPFSVREGINIFLAGFVPTENLRFRDEVWICVLFLSFLSSLPCFFRVSFVYLVLSGNTRTAPTYHLSPVIPSLLSPGPRLQDQPERRRARLFLLWPGSAVPLPLHDQDDDSQADSCRGGGG